MGEAKRKRSAMSEKERLAHGLARELSNKGLLIAGGFAIYATMNNLSKQDTDYEAFRIAFLAGAEHVFMSMFGGMLDEGREETPADLRRMDLLFEEVKGIRQELELRYGKTEGSA